MEFLQRSLGIGVFGHPVGVLQFPLHRLAVLFRQVIEHVAPLMDLAALDAGGLARMTTHRRSQRLTAIQHIQAGHAEVQAASGQITEQLANHRGVLGCSLAQPQHRFAPVPADPQATIIWRSRNGVPSISTAHSRNSPRGRSSNSRNFSRLASTKFSLTADFSIP